MKKILSILCLLFLYRYSFGAIVVGKSGSNSETGSDALAVTWTGGGSSTAGSCLVVAIFEQSDFPRTFSVSDGANTYSSSYTYSPHGDCKTYVYVVPNASAVSSITVTPAGYDLFGVSILEVQGIVATSPVDKKDTAPYDNGWKSGTTWTSNATGTLSQADEIVLAVLYDTYESVTAYAGTGWAAGSFVTGYGSGVLSKIVSATDSVTAAGTLTVGAGDYEVYSMVITLKGASSGGATTASPVCPIVIINDSLQ